MPTRWILCPTWLQGEGCCGDFSSFDAVAGAALLEDFGVEDNTVNHGGGDSDIAEALRSLGKRQVGRHDDRPEFVSA